MVLLLARVIGIGIETADMLVQEILSRNLRDRRAVARYAGLTGSPDESGKKRREKGLARSGNARVRLGMIQLAWRFLQHQKDSALVKWFDFREWVRRLGAFAADAHTASWFGSLAHRIQGCGATIRDTRRELPSTRHLSSRPRQICRRARSRQGPCGWR